MVGVPIALRVSACEPRRGPLATQKKLADLSGNDCETQLSLKYVKVLSDIVALIRELTLPRKTVDSELG